MRYCTVNWIYLEVERCNWLVIFVHSNSSTIKIAEFQQLISCRLISEELSNVYLGMTHNSKTISKTFQLLQRKC
jgi:hypothetical protein